MTTHSTDGTKIEFDAVGDGPALVVVDGALCTRAFGSKPELVADLATDFTVVSYDRRGRGGSADTLPYTIEREVEDLESVIDVGGGSAFVYGHSSGGCLVLESAVRLGPKITKLAIYEAPYNDDPLAMVAWGRYIPDLLEALRSGRRGDAVALFMAIVGTPPDQIDAMRRSSGWPSMESVAPTLAYDHAGLLRADGSIPTDLVRQVAVPSLVLHGGESYPFMGETARSLSAAIPGAELRTLPGQTHNVEPAVISPVLVDFFRSAEGPSHLLERGNI